MLPSVRLPKYRIIFSCFWTVFITAISFFRLAGLKSGWSAVLMIFTATYSPWLTASFTSPYAPSPNVCTKFHFSIPQNWNLRANKTTYHFISIDCIWNWNLWRCVYNHSSIDNDWDNDLRELAWVIKLSSYWSKSLRGGRQPFISATGRAIVLASCRVWYCSSSYELIQVEYNY